MITGTYIYYKDISNSENISGISQKVIDQINCFSRFGISCDFEYVPAQENRVLRALGRRLPYIDEMSWPRGYTLERIADKDYVYIRRPPSCFSGAFLRFLGNLKKLNPSILILIEIPTFPYDYERKRKFGVTAKDRHWRQMLRKYVDMIFFMGEEGNPMIFGCQATRITNGIDLNRVSLTYRSEPAGEIHLVCAARFNFWHGIDRLIEGMHEYCSRRNPRKITLHLIGDGYELDKYHSLVAQYGLSEAVAFHGFCNHDEMSTIMRECSIGISSLGRHRSGHKLSSALKEREYLAQGMPFVYSCDIDVFGEEGPPFCLKVPENDSPIDMESVVAFHDGLFASYDLVSLSEEIRRRSIPYISIDSTMRPVIDYIENNAKRKWDSIR